MADQIGNDNPSNIGGQPASTETADERASRLEEANKKLYQRAKEAEAEAKEAKAKLAEAKPAISENKTQPSELRPSDILKADEFKLFRAGYNESEIDLIMHNGGAKILEDKKNPLVMGLQAAKEQRQAEEAAGKTTDSSGLSDIERKYTEQDMRNMKKEDLEKLIPHVTK
jgi:hypothetical protein